MTATLVDSSVLLDIFTEDPDWFEWSSRALAEAAESSRLVINIIVFAEVSAGYAQIEEIEDVLPAEIINEPITKEMAFLAGKAFVGYRRRGGHKLSPLPDFFIGAHAAVAGYRLLTRDATRMRTYFPHLRLIAPAS